MLGAKTIAFHAVLCPKRRATRMRVIRPMGNIAGATFLVAKGAIPPARKTSSLPCQNIPRIQQAVSA